MKVCTKCKIEKDESEFHKSSRNKSGIISQCMPCKNSIIAAWHSKHPEKAKEYSLISYYRYHEQKKAKAREYKASNQIKLKQSMKAWRVANREYTRAYYEENKSWFKTWNSRRRAQLANATVPWADLNKIRDIYKHALYLTEVTGIQHHVDHIIPLNSRYVCGLHVEYNLQILTEQDNLTKSNKFTPG